jgi:hypothetical protein
MPEPSIAQTRRSGACSRAKARTRFAPKASVGTVKIGDEAAGRRHDRRSVGQLVGADPDDSVDLVCEHRHGCPPVLVRDSAAGSHASILVCCLTYG